MTIKISILGTLLATAPIKSVLHEVELKIGKPFQATKIRKYVAFIKGDMLAPHDVDIIANLGANARIVKKERNHAN